MNPTAPAPAMAAPASPAPPAASLLFICTGNMYRSPIAERLLRARLGTAGTVRVGSAGTSVPRDVPAGEPGLEPATREMIEKFGGDPADFRPRRLTAELVAGSDLVLGLAREHREAAVGLCPVALRRCFTLKEFLRLAETTTGPGGTGGGTSAERVAGTSAERVARAAARRGNLELGPLRPCADDIADPSGKRREVLLRCAQEIDAAVTALAVVLR